LFIINDKSKTNNKDYFFDEKESILYTNGNDVYDDQTIKTRCFIKWFLKESDASHFWRFDDDNYVNCNLFNQYDEYLNYDYTGSMLYLEAERTLEKKELYFMSGAGYCLSRKSAEVVDACKNLPKTTGADDYFVGRIISEDCPDAKRLNSPQINPFSGCEYIPNLMIGHYVDADHMELMHNYYYKPKTKSKIGLCMIVKDESRVIKRCLDSLKPIIDYVCISDTGSTDNTVQIIHDWLKENNVQGEVIGEEWKDFAYNRSKALKNIRKHKDIDYVITIDADEILKFDKNFDVVEFKNNLTCDLYYITCKFGGIEYARTNLFKNALNPYYKGVVHEYLETEKPIMSRDTAKGIYNVPIQDSARNQNTQKYQHDAKVLENALKTETDPFLIQRYTFYLAQSYKDCEQNGKAIYWYNKRAELGGWDQEIYWSLYQVARLKEIMGYPEDDIVQSYLRAYEKCTSRIEALHNAIKFCRTHGRDHQAYMIGKHAKSLPIDKTGLFVETWMIDYALDDEFSIACYWSGHYAEGLKISEDLINKIPEDQKPRIQQNIDFFKQKLNPA
jgi:glycosyltransferase involved in cell wall biosynthesis